MIDISNLTEYQIDEGHIKRAILASLEHVGVPEACEISVAIVSPAEIQALNKKYRGKDSVTDCLSFPMGEDNLLGDIVICYEQAEKQAAEIGQSVEKELAFLSIHSTLHLLGFDHADKHGEEEMLQKQRTIFANLF
ncbi:MAG: rRNA maturation RNase YbeY [Oscillospiraceae bacterium]|nr:rRNA maturation RNase YbeY [Oscillospiraceae bacterium]